MSRTIAWSLLYLFSFFALPMASALEQCVPDGQWLTPQNGNILTDQEYLSKLPKDSIVLLGEHHANHSHHVWQLSVIKKLYEQQQDMMLGMEMFPRRVQPILDRWIRGEISKTDFYQQVEWDNIWAFNFDDYYPILKFAQANKIPLLALNVDKELLQTVREVGWHKIPEEQRQGITDPARPSREYAKQLAVSFKKHSPQTRSLDKIGFKHFVQKQLLWDRAMAEALAKAQKQNPGQLIVGMMGSWHIIDKHGVPYQLEDLDAGKTITLVPWDNNLDCNSINKRFADAIYGTIHFRGMSLGIFD